MTPLTMGCFSDIVQLLLCVMLLVKLDITSKTLRSPPRLGQLIWNISVTNHPGYVQLVVSTSWSFPHSWFITGTVTRLTRQVPIVEQEIPTLPEHPSTPLVFSGVRVTRSLVLCVCFVDLCLFFFFWPLCCLPFYDLQILFHIINWNCHFSTTNLWNITRNSLIYVPSNFCCVTKESSENYKIMKKKFKQWWWPISPISTKWTITAHPTWHYWTQKRPRHMTLEIQILTWNWHTNVAGLTSYWDRCVVWNKKNISQKTRRNRGNIDTLKHR
jgi:hypothetical protein